MAKHDWQYIIGDAYRCRTCGKSIITGSKNKKDKMRTEKLRTEECPGPKKEAKDG